MPKRNASTTRPKDVSFSGSKGPAVVADAFEDHLELPSTLRLRALAQWASDRIAEKVTEGSSVVIDETVLTLKTPSTIALGPARVAIERKGGSIAASFRTADSQSRPLHVELSLPVGEGEVRLNFDGGPVPLDLFASGEPKAVSVALTKRASLEGHGSVRLFADGMRLDFDGIVRVRDVGFSHTAIAPDPIEGLDVDISAKGELSDRSSLRLESFDVALGAAHVRGAGSLAKGNGKVTGDVRFEVPTVACQSLLESTPSALLPVLTGARLAGTLRGAGHVSFDSSRLDDTSVSYKFEDLCSFESVPSELDKRRFAGTFTHRVYLADGTLAETTTGPGSPRWTDLENVSPYMEVAVRTTEDGSFRKHKGFNHYAIRNAIVANLKARRFVRGASTISMQLAKNLFLVRDKTLSRKLEELVLTEYLEQTFTKSEMLELYFNVIEFGPDVYGIRDAAEFYFGRAPDELTLQECMFLASLLPSPVRYSKLADSGRLGESWQRHLSQLLDISLRVGLVTKEEREGARDTALVFYKAGNPRPEPRDPVGGGRLDGAGDDW
ncbi:MAG: transglycosylase domain-containing protein [Polyangiaceae bacterium]